MASMPTPRGTVAAIPILHREDTPLPAMVEPRVKVMVDRTLLLPLLLEILMEVLPALKW